MNFAIKADAEKVRLDLLPVKPLLDVGKVLTYGANKYSPRNWERGFVWSRPYAAALRHLFAWFSGQTHDPETGFNHLAHAMCEIMFLMEFSYTHPEMDDRPMKEEINVGDSNA
ncbi:MAG: dATP/dGTP diphosphohydrolase domain-containing protein [Synergistota bacterium]|nr:dATP/dGTP diphosphohydrolase domain-containing protein [Synergistota bacterium]